jgi:hypothetical protein
LATLGFKQPYCGRRGYTAVGRRHPSLATSGTAMVIRKNIYKIRKKEIAEVF